MRSLLAVLATIFVYLVFLPGCEEQATNPVGFQGVSSAAIPGDSDPPAAGVRESLPAVGIPVGAGIAVGPVSAGKATMSLSSSVEQSIGLDGGKLVVIAPDGLTVVRFGVPEGALEACETIRMELFGSGANLRVGFGPGGLRFSKPATLTILFPTAGLAEDEINGYLITDDGPQPVPVDVRVSGPLALVTIYVSHFSLYSPSDGESAAHDSEGYGGYGGGGYWGYGW